MSIGTDFREDIVNTAKKLAGKCDYWKAYLLLRGARLISDTADKPYMDKYEIKSFYSRKWRNQEIEDDYTNECPFNRCLHHYTELSESDLSLDFRFDCYSESIEEVDSFYRYKGCREYGTRVVFKNKLKEELFDLLGIEFPD